MFETTRSNGFCALLGSSTDLIYENIVNKMPHAYSVVSHKDVGELRCDTALPAAAQVRGREDYLQSAAYTLAGDRVALP